MEWISKLSETFKNGVERLCFPDTGVIFSAGVDSALAAYVASDYMKLTAYTVGIEGSKDLEYAKKIESTAPFDIKFIELTLDDVEKLIPVMVKLSQSTNPLNIGVGIPFYCASKAASADGKTSMLCGQAGDELFGGYWRYLVALVKDGEQAVIDWMEKDWNNSYSDNLDRDIAMCKHNKIQLKFPYLYNEFSDYVRSMPFNLKIREDADIFCDEIEGRFFARKYALKKLALEFGMPDYIVNRLKKAAQYGSGTQQTLDKIARSHGYKKRAQELDRNDVLKLYLEDIQKELQNHKG